MERSNDYLMDLYFEQCQAEDECKRLGISRSHRLDAAVDRINWHYRANAARREPWKR